MNDFRPSSDGCIDKLYRENYARVYNYISSRINDASRAEDLTQDVWLRILTSRKEIDMQTAVPYLYVIARNLVNDYLRGYYLGRGAEAGLDECTEEMSDVTTDSDIITAEIQNLELMRVKRLPRQRRIIYRMCRFEDKGVSDIAAELSLSTRTVENHLRIGRREVRQYVAAAV